MLSSALAAEGESFAVTSGLQAGDTVAYNSALNVSGSSGEMQFVVDGGDMGDAPAGGGPGGGGPGGGF